MMQEGDTLYSPANISLLHHVNAALRAHVLFEKNVDYIVTPDGEVVIVDEHTGRTMPGRRWSDGLHQAVEAKKVEDPERKPNSGFDHFPKLLPSV